MRFLIDADLPRDTATFLASYGHVAVDSRDVGLKSAADPQIAEYARVNGLCILTADWGFSDFASILPTNIQESWSSGFRLIRQARRPFRSSGCYWSATI